MHLIITIQNTGAQRLFDHPLFDIVILAFQYSGDVSLENYAVRRLIPELARAHNANVNVLREKWLKKYKNMNLFNLYKTCSYIWV